MISSLGSWALSSIKTTVFGDDIIQSSVLDSSMLKQPGIGLNTGHIQQPGIISESVIIPKTGSVPKTEIISQSGIRQAKSNIVASCI